jgi:hypothetical protein
MAVTHARPNDTSLATSFDRATRPSYRRVALNAVRACWLQPLLLTIGYHRAVCNLGLLSLATVHGSAGYETGRREVHRTLKHDGRPELIYPSSINIQRSALPSSWTSANPVRPEHRTKYSSAKESSPDLTRHWFSRKGISSVATLFLSISEENSKVRYSFHAREADSHVLTSFRSFPCNDSAVREVNYLTRR